jgi:hypothetical protein
MRQRRLPLGAMLFGVTALLAAWSMAALAGMGADRDGSRNESRPRDVPMVVSPPGGPNPPGRGPIVPAGGAAPTGNHGDGGGTGGEARGSVGARTHPAGGTAGTGGPPDHDPASCAACPAADHVSDDGPGDAAGHGARAGARRDEL